MVLTHIMYTTIYVGYNFERTPKKSFRGQDRAHFTLPGLRAFVIAVSIAVLSIAFQSILRIFADKEVERSTKLFGEVSILGSNLMRNANHTFV